MQKCLKGRIKWVFPFIIDGFPKPTTKFRKVRICQYIGISRKVEIKWLNVMTKLNSYFQLPMFYY